MKNNTKNIKNYGGILKTAVAREQKDFDGMREVLHDAQNKNANKKRNFYLKHNIIENIGGAKRGIKENNDAAALPSIPSSVQDAKTSHIKFPTEDATWMQIRTSGSAHVDKTAYLEWMLDSNQRCFFITRPRRFGKSVFIQMVVEFFHGNEEAFKGLKIYERGNAAFFKTSPHVDPSRLENKKWLECPIIFLDFRNFDSFKTFAAFEKQYRDMIRFIARDNKISGFTKSGSTISTLIRELKMKLQLRVAILIDEYSYPIEYALYHMQNRTEGRIIATEIKLFFDTFFSCIKSSIGQELIRFVFITGISRMGLHALESGTNIFNDLTYNKAFATTFGFTEEEIWENLLEPEMAEQFNVGNKITTKEQKIEHLIDQLKYMYDGYNFTIKNGKKGENVFNPISTMKCLKDADLSNHWCSTGSLQAIIAKMYFSNVHIEDLQECQVKYKEIIKKRNPITEYIPIKVEMLVYGYLTVLDYNNKTDMVTLTLPNNEITTALKNEIKVYKPNEKDFLHIKPDWLLSLEFQMRIGNVQGTMNHLIGVFSGGYSKTLSQNVNEFDITRRLKSYLEMAQIYSIDSVKFEKGKSAEKQEGGNIDLLTSFLPVNFAFSIKVDKSAFVAIRAFCEYLSEYTDGFKEAIGNKGSKKLYLIGISFKKADGGTLAHWIYVPFIDGKMEFNKAEASEEYLLENNMFKSIIKDFSL